MPVSAIPARGKADAMLNVRMSRALKEAGDAALTRAGYTPTQAVRKLWEFAAAHADDPDEVARFVERRTQVSEKDPAHAAEIERRRAATARGANLYREGLAKLGIRATGPSELDLMDYKQLRELLIEERCFGEGDPDA